MVLPVMIAQLLGFNMGLCSRLFVCVAFVVNFGFWCLLCFWFLFEVVDQNFE